MNTLINLLKSNRKDVDFDFVDNEVEITFKDFCGFSADGEELDREFLNPFIEQEVFDYLNSQAKLVSEELYKVYSLDNYLVTVGYASFDI